MGSQLSVRPQDHHLGAEHFSVELLLGGIMGYRERFEVYRPALRVAQR